MPGLKAQESIRSMNILYLTFLIHQELLTVKQILITIQNFANFDWFGKFGLVLRCVLHHEDIEISEIL